MKIKLLNSFSLNMLKSEKTSILCSAVSREYFLKLRDAGLLESYIGHQDLANILGVPFNRATVNLSNEKIIVAQYRGERLPEGTTVLPQNSKIEFFELILTEI
ncbi:MAG: DUF1874 domain-containing protein [Patescibacteria group bacterium]|nr:DUF1874 domain-containing protein [Patescibacteria group bacterium]